MDTRLHKHCLGFYTAVDKPSVDDLKDYYSNKYFQTNKGNYRSKYTSLEQNYFNEKIKQYAYVVEKLRGVTPGSMLDVGCGEGFALAHFLGLNWHVDGLDFNDAGIRNKNPVCLPYLETGDVFELLENRLYGNYKYDLIWLTNVLEHVPDPIRLLAQLRGLLSTTGVLVVAVPNDFSDLQEVCLKNGYVDNRFWIGLPDHLSYFNAASLRAAAESTGYKCRYTLADFPIDLFLLNPNSNYIKNKSLGPDAHHARIQFENLIAQKPLDDVIAYYEAMAKVGLGRQIISFFM